jgi:hypothetical protein
VLEEGLVHQPIVPEGMHQSDLLNFVELGPFGQGCLFQLGHKLLVPHALSVLQLRHINCRMEKSIFIRSKRFKVLLNILQNCQSDELCIGKPQFRK